jgi:HAD superfamily hydrolase (TIGR01549 family)
MVKALAGDEAEERAGEDIRAAESALYLSVIEEVEPVEGARELIDELKRRGCTVVLASSAKANELDHYLDMLDARDVVDAWTSSADVEATKPEPDLIKAALARIEDDDGVMVGDSTWDFEAAERAGVPSVAVLTGGFSEQELTDAGASEVFKSVEELSRSLDRTPLAGSRAQADGR